MPSIAQTYFVNGDAEHTEGECYQLTNDVNWQNGTVWYADKIDLESDFDLQFYMNFGSRDAGADGIVFVLQNQSNKAIGQGGGGLGYEGFSPSLGVEFDDFYNGNIGDPTYDHVAVMRDGNIAHSGSGQLHSAVPAKAGGGNIEDGQDHIVRVIWVADSMLLEVFFDCTKRIRLTYDIQENIFEGERYVFWGFTAATGGERNTHTVCLREDIFRRDTVSMCKGSELMLNARPSFDNAYLWSPSIDLDNNRIRNPICTAVVPRTYTVRYLDQCSIPVQDTVQVLISEPFEMDEVDDTLLCDNSYYLVDLTDEYDSVRWEDGFRAKQRFLFTAGYYQFRAWKEACWDDDSLYITTDERPQLEIVGDSFFCTGDSVTLKIQSSPESAFFYWDNGSTDSTLTLITSAQPLVIAVNDCGSAQARYSVREIRIPPIRIGGDTIYCPGNEVRLEVLSYEPYAPVWSDGDLSVIRLVDSGFYKVTISDQDCLNSDSISVFFRPHPAVELQSAYLLCDFEPLLLRHDQAWTDRTWSIGGSALQADYTEEEGWHWLKVYNECGLDSFPFQIEREYCTCDLWVPNAFTPNFDGNNERFKATPDCDKLTAFHLRIYNRWGELLFETNDFSEGWDGTFKGRPVQQDVYLWLVDYEGIEGRFNSLFSRMGTVHLLR